MDDRLLAPDPPQCAVHHAAQQGQLPLFLLTAAAITLDLLPDDVRPVFHQKLQDLRFRGPFQAHFPVLSEVSLPNAKGYIVKDGHGRRAYVTGSPAALAALCPLMMDGQSRPMTEGDRQNLARLSGYAYAMAAVTEDGMEPLCYLGALSMADAAEHPALRSARLLMEKGYTVLPWREGDPLPKNAMLFALPDAAKGLPTNRDDSFHQAVEEAVVQAQQRQHKLLAAGCMLAAVLLLGLLSAAMLWVLPVACCVMLLPLVPAKAVRRPGLLGMLLVPVLFAAAGYGLCVFLQLTGHAPSPAGALATVLAALCLGQHPLWLKPAKVTSPWRLAGLVAGIGLAAALWLTQSIPLVCGLFALTAGMLVCAIAMAIAGRGA